MKPSWLVSNASSRKLPASQHARDMQRLARQEVHRLLGGSTAGRDLRPAAGTVG
jgi:hypothetical protein